MIKLDTKQMEAAMATQRNELTQNDPPSPWHFDFSVIDDPTCLDDSYALRYEVYCKERHFLTPENYPTNLEIDPYDNHSIHVGGIDNNGVMIGTVRLVLPSAKGFPLFEHCDLFPEFRHLADQSAQMTTAEVSRLAISKSYRRRLNDGFYNIEYKGDCDAERHGEQRSRAHISDAGMHRRHKPEIIWGLYKAMYQASKLQGITHWFAAMEKPLLRLMRRCFHIDFTPIGPELDYYGPVVPYIIGMAEIEGALLHHRSDLSADFFNGLEPEFVPDILRK